METNDTLRQLASDVSEIKECLLGNPMYKQEGLVSRVTKIECDVKTLKNWKVWVIGAFAGIGFICGIVITLYNFLV